MSKQSLDSYKGPERAQVGYYWDTHRQRTMVDINGGYGGFDNVSITLDVKQSLSLLKWLLQEKETLEKGKE